MVILFLRLALAAVLAVAAVAKLRDRDGAREAAVDLGVPRRLGDAVVVVLPAAELAVAAGLVPVPTARVAAAAVAALLVVFTVAIGVALVRGRAPACHCFGDLSAAPAGPATLARNAALLGAAVAVGVAGPGASAWTPAVAIAAAAVAAVAGGVLGVLRILAVHGRVLLRLDALEQALGASGVALPEVGGEAARASAPAGLPAGAPAPALARLGHDARRPTLVLFTDAACGPCRTLAADVAAWRARSDVAVRTVSARADDGVVLVDVVDPDGAIAAAFAVTGTPQAVLIGADGRIASGLAAGADAVRALAASAIPASATAREVASAALSTLDGEVVDVAALGEEAVLVFWNPGCGYCRAMLDDWRALGDPAGRVIAISGAGEDALRADDLPAEVLRDPGGVVARALGATGTPMAVRIDGHGRAVSPVAAGGPASLALLRAGARPKARLIEVVR